MKISEFLSQVFDHSFEQFLEEFGNKNGLRSDQPLLSERHLNRCIIPNVKNLSNRFNRLNENDLSRSYWGQGSSPVHFRSSYLITYHLFNLIRIAGIFEELERLGWAPKKKDLKVLELGSGFASGVSAMAMNSLFSKSKISAFLIEADASILKLSQKWIQNFFHFRSRTIPKIRTFQNKIENPPFIPKTAPKFDLIIISYFINELQWGGQKKSKALVRLMEDHLQEDGVMIIIEPALKIHSRELLEIRKEFIRIFEKKNSSFQVLLPCLGHQECGAFENLEDWCHEEVIWWRPPYIKYIDKKSKLDHKRLSFSYLVLSRSKKSKNQILSKLKEGSLYRQVSPSHKEGKSEAFYLCGKTGKNKCRAKPCKNEGRGRIIVNPKFENKKGYLKIISDS